MRKIEVWAEVHELNDQGDYAPVEVSPKPDVPCGGVLQLRQVHGWQSEAKSRPYLHFKWDKSRNFF